MSRGQATHGRLAQLEERLLYTQEAGGSIPSPPTIIPTPDSFEGDFRGRGSVQLDDGSITFNHPPVGNTEFPVFGVVDLLGTVGPVDAEGQFDMA